MALYLSRSKDIQPTSSVIKTQKKGRTLTYTSLGEFIASREEHVNVFISNYTNKYITFNKGEHVGHLEPPIEDMQQISQNSESLTAHSITTKKLIAKKVKPDIFKSPHHMLRKDIKTKLEELLKEYQSQFA